MFFFPYRENLSLELITSKSKMIKAFCNKNCMFEFVKDLPIKKCLNQSIECSCCDFVYFVKNLESTNLG